MEKWSIRDRWTLTSPMSHFLIAALIIGGAIAVVVHRGLQMKKLAHDGVLAEGRVIEKPRRSNTQGRGGTGYLRYEFTAANGRCYERRVAVGEEIYAKYGEGDGIGVVYLPDDPKVNAARYMVNLSRQALKLPPL